MKSIYFWIIVFVIILFLIWLFFGGSYEFVGWKPIIQEIKNQVSSVCEIPESEREPEVCHKDNRKFASKGEEACCRTLEKLFGLPFDKIRPDWLKNPETGRRLELDCYNDLLKLAVEYNGIHHYIFPNWTGNTEEEFTQQVRRDMFKVDECDRNGVYLITVPYTVSMKDIEQYIKDNLPDNLKTYLEVRNLINGN